MQYLDDQLSRASVALLDEQFGASKEIVKDVLLVVQRARLTPGDAILPATPAAAQGTLQLQLWKGGTLETSLEASQT